MFFDDHAKSINTIMSKRHPKGMVEMDQTPMKPEIVKTQDGEMDGKHLAAQDILAAHHSKSASKMREAMENFIDLHMHGSKKE
jgi:hypothetical protein